MRRWFVLIAALLGLVLGRAVAARDATPGASPAAGCPTTTVDENKALVRSWFETWRTGDLAAFDGQIVADYVHHWGQGPDSAGSAAFKQRVGEFRTAFPDIRFTIDQVLAEGDSVAVRWTAHGTHQGPFRGVAPTGRAVTWTGINVFRIACGRLVEGWNETDDAGLLQQIGVPPAVGTPAVGTPPA